MADNSELAITLLKTKEGRKALASQSMAFFFTYYLDLDIDEHHEKWISHLKSNRIHEEAPRDHGKSTIFSFGYPLWAMYNVDNVRCLIVSKTGGPTGVSSKVRDAIIQEMKTNERLLEDYGNIIDREKGGSVFCKRTKRGIKDPSLESIGTGGAITGGHYDIILADDLIDEKNSRTAIMREQVYDWFTGTLMELLEPNSKIIVVGTRKHYDDLYKRIMDNKLWNVYVEKAIIKYPEHYQILAPDEEGYDLLGLEGDGELQIINDCKVYVEGEYEVLWKEKWTIFQLLYNKYDIGSIMFNREKQNDPSGMQGRILNANWIKSYEDEDLPEDMMMYMGVDLAVSEKTTADYMAIAVCGYSMVEQKIYLLDLWRGHKTFPEQVGMIEVYANKWAPTRITIESNAYQSAMIQYHNAINMLPVVGSPTTKDKVTRMMALSPHIENGKLLFNNTIPYYDNFLEEYVQFPSAAHDDLLDSIEICVRPVLSSGEVTFGTWASNKQVEKQSWFTQ